MHVANTAFSREGALERGTSLATTTTQKENSTKSFCIFEIRRLIFLCGFLELRISERHVCDADDQRRCAEHTRACPLRSLWLLCSPAATCSLS